MTASDVTALVPWFLGVGFTLLGGLLAWTGLSSVGRHVRRSRTWHRGRATVVGYDWRGRSGRQVQHWVMERTDSLGRTHRAVSELGVSGGTLRPFPFDVDVLVDPADGATFVLAGGCRSGWGGLLLGLVGGIFHLAGLVILGVLLLR